jgi:hypothetical protein
MMNNKQQDEDNGLEGIGIGLPERGVPMPRSGGFLGRLRRTLERLEVGMSAQLLNVSIKQERYIRQRMPTIGREMDAKFSVRVADRVRDRSSKRTLRVYRVE